METINIVEYVRLEITVYCKIDDQKCIVRANISNPRNCRECLKSQFKEEKAI